jgi:hypothetical protein
MKFLKVFFSADNAEEYIKNLIAYKTLYKTIIEKNDNELLSKEDRKELLSTLAVNNFDIKR